MLTLIRLHCRPVPALRLPTGHYVVGGDMLRMRAVYVHRPSTDYAGMPTIGAQVFRVIVSDDDRGGVRINVALQGRRGVSLQVPGIIRWGLANRLRRVGGIALYKLQRRIIYKLLHPSRNEHSYIPSWNVRGAQ